MIRVATCVPEQRKDRAPKLEWLEGAIDRAKADLFLAPQEYLGGHWIMPHDQHIEAAWFERELSALAKRKKVALGVGATVVQASGGATQDYAYFSADGTHRGTHRKFAHPGYDDVRAGGAGRLWPETSYAARTRPIELPELGLKVGTVFCWEVFSLTLFPAYSFAGVNLIAHPIKFAPRGWPKLDKTGGKRSIKGFGNPGGKGLDLWRDKLVMASRHEAMCPIAVSCNTWDLGKGYFALGGHVDELTGSTMLREVECLPGAELVHAFDMNPAYYSAGLDAHFSAAQFKAKVGSLDGFHDLDPWTMHTKIRRLEAQLLGDTTRLDCQLKAATMARQKASIFKRMRRAQ